MKRFIFLIVLALTCFLCACGGDTSGVETRIGTSTIYEKSEIEQALDTVIQCFEMDFDGCSMTELWYDEEKSLEESDEWAKQYNANQAIILYSNFDVDESGLNNGFNPNSTYYDWKWILVRNNNIWELKTWGY